MSANYKILNVLSQAEQFAFRRSGIYPASYYQARVLHATHRSRFYSATVSGPRIFFALLRQQTTQIVSRDVTPDFIVAELIVFLREQKIVRPGYTTLQDLISEALSAERNRLGKLLNGVPIADGQLWNGYVFSAGDH